MSAKDFIAIQTCELSEEEFNDFLALYHIPPAYHVILPKSNQTVFDAPPGYVGLYTHLFSLANCRLPLTEFFCEVLEYFQVHISRLNPFGGAKLTTFVVMCKAYGSEPTVELFWGFFNLCRGEMAFRNFVYAGDEEDLSFLPKEPSLGFGTSSSSVSVNIEPLRADEEPVLHPAEVAADSGWSPKLELFVVHPRSVAAQIKDRKCKTMGGSSRPPVKRKLVSGSSNSRATRAKTSTSKDDVPFRTISDDDEGLPDVPELKGATAFHLNISAITPPA
ncbi:hypothetical protein Tco_1069962 [Tanacetum coccineum]|uniref:Transposase (putative) gypsy type domain-containing protein n=1 Tax=Tanacetum coccineum TaxID=301880 RepID=A0ABQ5HLW8_9ASTR